MADQVEPKRNPDWTRDETILALELYRRRQPRVPDEDDDEVIALSDELRALAAARGVRGLATFRNPTGVSMKLSNLRGGDPSNAGKGLPNGSEVEDQVWAEFGSDNRALAAAAAAIRQSFTAPAAQTERPALAGDRPRIWVTGMWGFRCQLSAHARQMDLLERRPAHAPALRPTVNGIRGSSPRRSSP